MTIKNANAALDHIFYMAVNGVKKYGRDKYTEHREMMDKMDGVITCVIWCTEGNQYLKVQKHRFELEDRFYDEC